MSLIYKPGGAALEYARWAANLFVGCVHGCSYCYVPGIFRKPRGEFKAEARIKGNGDGETILRQLDKNAAALAARGERRPILLSFTCDPYQPLEAEALVTRRALEIFNTHGLTAAILTKAGVLVERDFDLIKASGHILGTTLTGRRASEDGWEPDAAHHRCRVATLAWAKKCGIRTWASIEPVIYHLDSLEAIRETAGHVDHFAIGKMNHFNPPQPIDWRAFRKDMEGLLKGLGYRRVGMEEAWLKPAGTYYLKRDLLKASN